MLSSELSSCEFANLPFASEYSAYKELLLLENHLIGNPAICPSCQLKHIISAIAFLEEASRLGGKGDLEIAKKLDGLISKVSNVTEANPEVAREIRAIRKELEKKLFDTDDPDTETITPEIVHKEDEDITEIEFSSPKGVKPDIIKVEVTKDWIITTHHPRELFDPRSFRTITPRGLEEPHRIIIGCPKGYWDDINKLCRTSTKVYQIIHPHTPEDYEKYVEKALMEGVKVVFLHPKD